MVYLCSYIKSPTAFIYCYGSAFGVGKGLMYSSALHAGWSHLQERIGLVSGFIICGFGFGGFIFGIISNRLANPDNVDVQIYSIEGIDEQLFPSGVAERVPYMLRTLDIIWISLFTFGVICISTYDHSESQDQTSEQALLNDDQRKQIADEQENLTPEEREKIALEKRAEETIPLPSLLMTGKFLWLYVLVVSHMFYGYYMTNQFKQYGFTGGIDDKTLSTIGSAGALFNGCFKIVWASLLDYFNFKPLYSMILVVQLTCLTAVHWAHHHAGSYALVVCLSFMCDGSMTSMIPVVTN